VPLLAQMLRTIAGRGGADRLIRAYHAAGAAGSGVAVYHDAGTARRRAGAGSGTGVGHGAWGTAAGVVFLRFLCFLFRARCFGFGAVRRRAVVNIASVSMSASSPVPAQLPADVPGLRRAGRRAGETLAADDGRGTRGDRGGVRTAGVGKTALAIHWAHGP